MNGNGLMSTIKLLLDEAMIVIGISFWIFHGRQFQINQQLN